MEPWTMPALPQARARALPPTFTPLAPLALVALLAPGGAAQGNKLEIFPDSAGTASSYVVRSNLNASAGEVLQEVPSRLFRGVGATGTGAVATCTALGLDFWTADEDASTQETFTVLLRRAAIAAPGPDATPAGILVQSGPQMTPLGTGRLGWRVMVTFTTPVAIPCEGDLFMGLGLAAAPTWATDGQSIYSAFYPGFLTATVGDNPRNGAPNHSWYVLNGVAAPSTWHFTLRIGVLVAAPVLNMGGVDPANARQMPVGSANFGAGGLYPDVSGGRNDGLDARVIDATNAGGTAFLLLAGGWVPGGLSAGTVDGRLWLLPAPLLQFGMASLVGSTATINVVAPATLGPGLIGFDVPFQAVTLSAALQNPRLSNGCAVSF